MKKIMTLCILLFAIISNNGFTKVIWDKNKNQWYDTRSGMYYDQVRKLWYNPRTGHTARPGGYNSSNNNSLNDNENKNSGSAQNTNVSSSLNEIVNGFNQIHRKYGVRVHYRRFRPSRYARRYTRWQYLTNADNVKLKKLGKILIRVFNKYPVDFVRKTKLRAIALVKNMSVQGQKRGAMPDAYGEVLYLSTSIVLSYSKTYTEHVIHHEYYHMIEQQFNGSMYYKDPRWVSLNVPGTRYGRGGMYMRNPSIAWKKHPAKGFVNGYSTSAVEEDKAEVFAFLMTPDEYRKVLKWMRTDLVLRAKFNYMKRFLYGKSKEFTESYFNRNARLN